MASSGVNGVGNQSSSQDTKQSSFDPYASLNTESFMKLLVTEMQSQDPMDPMKNQDILQQLSQIRSITASDALTTTLQSVLLGQNVSTASSMIGRTISGLSDDAEQVSGRVDGVTITGGQAKLHVGDSTVSLNNVSEIQPDSSGSGS
jgi:flagellar basal-body rod modification protein FlgD